MQDKIASILSIISHIKNHKNTYGVSTNLVSILLFSTNVEVELKFG